MAQKEPMAQGRTIGAIFQTPDDTDRVTLTERDALSQVVSAKGYSNPILSLMPVLTA
jgi:hypothetical protein